MRDLGRRLATGIGAVGIVVAASSGLGAVQPSGGGTPILVVTSTANPFTRYYTEILHAEGLNGFRALDIADVSATTLAAYDVVVLGEMPVTAGQAAMFSDWVGTGGNLVAMRPDKRLAGLLGLTDIAATRADGYLMVDTSRAPGAGIVGQTIQYHGVADLYSVTDATVVATLYASAVAASSNPAVTVRAVGPAGGQAAAFTYDLARSVVFTRQGNPAWSGQERDGQSPIRSDDLFFGGGQANYVDLSKVAIPQADEQQRLLVNLIGFMNADRAPLPRFWYFPRGLKAVVVMTGDDHAHNGTAGRFDIFNSVSPPGCSVADWECVRGTSYIFPNTSLTDAEVASYTAQGFEIGLHMWMSGLDAGSAASSMTCNNFTPASIAADYPQQLNLFRSLFPSAPPVRTNRTHCIVWSDFDTQPQVAAANGIRFDTNYYYWPPGWVNNVPGVFTGSGMPMRFAKADGTIVDVFQATTQMTDESGQTYPYTSDKLLDRALGPEGYYGAFVANMHTDVPVLAASSAIVASAQVRGVPVVSSRQMLDWLDGRNASTIESIAWDGTGTLTFALTAAQTAHGLQGMIPFAAGNRTLTGLSRDGAGVTYSTQFIKGVAYAFFPAISGSYAASFTTDFAAPAISDVTASASVASATLTWTTSELATTRVDYGTTPALGLSRIEPGLSTTHTVAISGLGEATTYYYRVTSADAVGNTATVPDGLQAPASFVTTSLASLNCPCMLWPASATPAQVSVADPQAIEVGVRFRAAVDGFVTGIRFYKGPSNTGVHLGNLWTATGTLLATLTFVNEGESGWQQASFSSPVRISGNTTYVVSYHSNTGFYSADAFYFRAPRNSGPLQGLADGFDGPNGLYRYGLSVFPTETFNSNNYWVDVVFETSATIDTVPPVVTAASPVPGATAVPTAITVTATFSEPMNAASLTASSFELRDASGVVPATVTYAAATRTASLVPTGALDGGTTYSATVAAGGSVTDLAGNPLMPVSWSFTTDGPPPLSLTDTTAADFSAGDPGQNLYVASSGDGEILLAPAVGAEFSGTSLPAGWSSAAWAPEGLVTVDGQRLVTDGARASLDALLTPGRRLEFVTTFSPTAPIQHVGFGLTFNEAPWIIFSTGPGGALYARTHDGLKAVDTLIPGNWLGSPRRFRIDWTPTSVTFYIDGTQVVTRAVAIRASLRPIVSDYDVGAGALAVDWIRITPYATSGVFTSRVLDAGDSEHWSALGWNAVVPPTTSLGMAVRFGDTPVPDGSWTPFFSVATSGSPVSATSRYVQYQASLAGTGAESVELRDVTITGGSMISPPTISVNDVVVVEPTLSEGAPSFANATFTVTLSHAVASTTTVSYATADGTAASGADFSATSGNLNFPPGVTSLPVTVPVLGDASAEPDETFQVVLSSPANGTLGRSRGTGTIVDSSTALPSLSIADATLVETNAGLITVSLRVTLSAPSAQMVTVGYSTTGGTAVSGSDFSPAAGTLSFQPGVVEQSIVVSVFGDSRFEADETFAVTLGNPVSATLLRPQATVTIVNDDIAPTLSISDVTVAEGNAGTSIALVSVTASAPSGAPITVNYATIAGTALAGSDYISTAGTLTIPPGSTSQSIAIPIIGDVLNEPDEVFAVALSGPAGATITRAQATVTVTDDDKPQISVASVAVTEGNTGTKNVVVTMTLSAPSAQQVSVSYSTADGTAVAGTDYVAKSGVVLFPAGSTLQTVPIVIIGDVLDEPDETFAVTLANPVNGVVAAGQATITITDNDAAPSIRATDASIAEGDSGTAMVTLNVTLSAPSSQAVTVAYLAADGTARAGDYVATGGTLTFAPGVTSLPLSVQVVGDTLSEANETVNVNLSAPTNATIADSRGVITILDDDPLPSITIGDASVTEGATGTKNMTFTLTLSAASGQSVTVTYATADGTATAGVDYTAKTGVVTFAAGVTTRTITVAITGDRIVEPSETFTVNLTAPTSATLARTVATGTILNDD